MMGGAAFTLLKTGRIWLESAKQVEIRLAILLKILWIAAPEHTDPGAPGQKRRVPIATHG
jgi:hypothetical protein